MIEPTGSIVSLDFGRQSFEDRDIILEKIREQSEKWSGLHLDPWKTDVRNGTGRRRQRPSSGTFRTIIRDCQTTHESHRIQKLLNQLLIHDPISVKLVQSLD
jgi:hypothetical protein